MNLILCKKKAIFSNFFIFSNLFYYENIIIVKKEYFKKKYVMKFNYHFLRIYSIIIKVIIKK